MLLWNRLWVRLICVRGSFTIRSITANHSPATSDWNNQNTTSLLLCFKYKEINCIIGLVFCFLLTFYWSARLFFNGNFIVFVFHRQPASRRALRNREASMRIRKQHKNRSQKNRLHELHQLYTVYRTIYVHTWCRPIRKKTYKSKKKKRIRKNTSKASTFQIMLVLNRLVFWNKLFDKNVLVCKV